LTSFISTYHLNYDCTYFKLFLRFSEQETKAKSRSSEMTSLSQSPRDRILWILANNGGRWSGAD
jgi:hypothetical protein